MTYTELRQKHQKEVNEFPLGFCFSNEQAKEMLSKWGLDWNCKDDLKKIISIGHGGYMRKSDLPAWEEMTKRHQKELEDFKKQEKQFIDAIHYEMANYELIYAYDDSDVKKALDLTDEDFKDPYVVECWNKALKRYKKECYENDLL